MSRKHSFVLTLSNNVTEKEGINYLMQNHTGFFNVNTDTKKIILDLLHLEHRYRGAFDMVYIRDLVGKELTADHITTRIEDVILVELKTTKKYLPNNPKGFFFGATENEFNFAKIMGKKFRFCFVCLNPNSPSFCMLTIDELEKVIKNKRIQFQINL